MFQNKRRYLLRKPPGRDNEPFSSLHCKGMGTMMLNGVMLREFLGRRRDGQASRASLQLPGAVDAWLWVVRKRTPTK
jgi:hypothetical protein